MSSSNIIRGGAASSIMPLEFRRIDEGVSVTPPPAVTSGFVPIHFPSMTGAGESVEEPRDALLTTDAPPVRPPPGMMQIPEEEFQARLDAAYRRGMDEGKELAERGLANVFRAMRQSIAELAGLKERILRESEDDLLKLSIAIARKIIQQEISADPGVLAALVAAAVADCISLDRITIRLNPADFEIVNRDRHRYLGVLSSETRVTLTPDDTLSPGDCVVDSVTGVIDARIETQLEEIYRKFSDERGVVSIESPGSARASQTIDDA